MFLYQKNLFFSINNLESLLCWIVWFVLFLTFPLLKWKNIHWEIFSFKKSLSTKEQSNILESLKVYIFLKFLFDCPTHKEPHDKVGSKSLAEHLVEIELGTFWILITMPWPTRLFSPDEGPCPKTKVKYSQHLSYNVNKYCQWHSSAVWFHCMVVAQYC